MRGGNDGVKPKRRIAAVLRKDSIVRTQTTTMARALFTCLTVSLLAACGSSDADLASARGSAKPQTYALQSAGNSASDVDAGPAGPREGTGEDKCIGFPLEGKCAEENGVSGRHLCASMIGVRFYPCPDGWTCRRDGDFLGCLPD